jgi:hypothetical protein
MWSYTSLQEDESGDELSPVVCVVFDHGSLFNNAMGNETEANIKTIPEEELMALEEAASTGAATNGSSGFPYNVCQSESMRATRDIQPGEGKYFGVVLCCVLVRLKHWVGMECCVTEQCFGSVSNRWQDALKLLPDSHDSFLSRPTLSAIVSQRTSI